MYLNQISSLNQMLSSSSSISCIRYPHMVIGMSWRKGTASRVEAHEDLDHLITLLTYACTSWWPCSCLICCFPWTCNLMCLTEYNTWWAIWASWSLDVPWLSASFFSRPSSSQEAVFQKVCHSPLWETLYPEPYGFMLWFFYGSLP